MRCQSLSSQSSDDPTGRHFAKSCFLVDGDRNLPAFGTYTGGLKTKSPELTGLMQPEAVPFSQESKRAPFRCRDGDCLRQSAFGFIQSISATAAVAVYWGQQSSSGRLRQNRRYSSRDRAQLSDQHPRQTRTTFRFINPVDAPSILWLV